MEKHIVIIAGTLGFGGAERQCYYICKELVALNAKVTLICLTSGEYYEKPIQNLGIEVINISRNLSRIQKLLKIIANAKKLNPTLIFSMHFYTVLYTYVAGFVLSTKFYASSRNLITEEINSNGILGKINLKLPIKWFVNSMQSVEIMKSMGKKDKDIVFLPNTIDIERFQYKEKLHFSKKILFVGRLVAQKNPLLFVEIFKNIYELDKQFTATIVGDGGLLKEVKSTILRYNLEKAIHVLSHTDKVQDLYYTHDFLISTSHYEGTPNVVLEAMASGLLVITTPVGDVPYFINNGVNGITYKSDNLDCNYISDKINYYTSDLNAYNLVTKNAKETIIEKYSFQNLSLKLNQHFLN